MIVFFIKLTFTYLKLTCM